MVAPLSTTTSFSSPSPTLTLPMHHLPETLPPQYAYDLERDRENERAKIVDAARKSTEALMNSINHLEWWYVWLC